MNTFTPHRTEDGWVVRHVMPNGEARYSDEKRGSLKDAFELAKALAAPAAGTVGVAIVRKEKAIVDGASVEVYEKARLYGGEHAPFVRHDFGCEIFKSGAVSYIDCDKYAFDWFREMTVAVENGRPEVLALVDFVNGVSVDYERGMC